MRFGAEEYHKSAKVAERNVSVAVFAMGSVSVQATGLGHSGKAQVLTLDAPLAWPGSMRALGTMDRRDSRYDRLQRILVPPLDCSC